MKDYEKRYFKRLYKFYDNNLSNFKTVMKDTNKNLVTAYSDDYNCMSYALGVYDTWGSLESFDQSYDTALYGNVDENLMADIFDSCCIELEERFSLRRVEGPDVVLNENERMIAFRISGDDFHFARKNSDNVWTHKPGPQKIKEMSREELLGEEWCSHRDFPYISEIAFFAIAI